MPVKVILAQQVRAQIHSTSKAVLLYLSRIVLIFFKLGGALRDIPKNGCEGDQSSRVPTFSSSQAYKYKNLLSSGNRVIIISKNWYDTNYIQVYSSSNKHVVINCYHFCERIIFCVSILEHKKHSWHKKDKLEYDH